MEIARDMYLTKLIISLEEFLLNINSLDLQLSIQLTSYERNKMLIYREKYQMLKSIACSNEQFFI